MVRLEHGNARGCWRHQPCRLSPSKCCQTSRQARPQGSYIEQRLSVFGSDSAAECLRIAQNTKHEDQKAGLHEMAEAWQRDGLNETSNLRSKRSRGLRANSVT